MLELMIVVMVVALGLALAVPSYENTIQKRRVTSAAESISAFLALAQGEAVKRNEIIAISVMRAGDGATWCAGAMIRTDDDDHCDCTLDPLTKSGEPDYCDFNPNGAGEPHVINQVGAEKFTMSGALSERVGDDQNDFFFGFDPIRGVKVDPSSRLILPSGHGVTLLSKNTKYELTVNVSVTGRIDICTNSTKTVPGFKPCAT